MTLPLIASFGRPTGHNWRDTVNADVLAQSAEVSLEKYYHYSEQADLYTAIDTFRKDLVASDDGGRSAEIKAGLSRALQLRFDVEDQDHDIKEAIDLMQRVVSSHTGNEDRRAWYWCILGTALWLWSERRSKSSGDALDRAITHLESSFDLLNGQQSDESILCRVSYAKSLVLARDLDPDQSRKPYIFAVSLMEKAVELTREGHCLRPLIFYHLADARYHVARATTDMDMMDHAANHLNNCLELLPMAHSLRPEAFNFLGFIYLGKYGTFGIKDDLISGVNACGQAADECPKHSAHRYAFQGNYYEGLLRRFLTCSDLLDLDRAFTGLEELLNDMPLTFRYRFHYIGVLGRALLEAYRQYGKADFLDTAIDLQKAAIPHAFPASLYYCYRDLAHIYRARFLALGHSSDLDEAIQLMEQAVTSCTDQDIIEAHHRRDLTADLSDMLITRFELLCQTDDVDNAISALQRCIKEDQPALENPRSGRYHYLLGYALLQRSIQSSDSSILDQAITQYQSAIRLIPSDHSLRPLAFSRFANACVHRFYVSHAIMDIHTAVQSWTVAVGLTPVGRSARAMYVSQLGKHTYTLSCVGHTRFNLSQVLSDLREAAADICSSTAGRFDASFAWASIAHRCELLEDALDGYRTAIGFLPQVASLGLDHRLRLQRLAAQSAGLCQNATACAIALGRPEEAVELFDRGRSIIWNSSQELRSDLTVLREIDPRLAEEFHELSAALDFQALRNSHPHPGNDSTNGDEEHKARTYRRLVDRWHELIGEIRTRRGLEDFLKPASYSDLRKAACGGAVIILNVSTYGCDALIVTEHLPIHRVPLSDVQLESVRQQVDVLNAAMDVKRDTCGRSFLEGVLVRVLKYLWDAIGLPVWTALKSLLPTYEPPRIWWCPVGLLARLPVHACGPSELAQKGMCDFVISSYAPTLSVLLRAKLSCDTSLPTSTGNFLGIGIESIPGHPSFDLPCASKEMCVIRESILGGSITFLEGSQATVSRVQALLPNFRWLHVAAHGVQRLDSPLQSCLLLHDGPLYVSDIAQKRLPHAEFAFLSACHSAKGTDALPDEALHLAGGFLSAGFKAVVGTQWAVADKDGPHVASVFYKILTKDCQALDVSKTAEALRQVTLAMREASLPTWRWVPFVHLGV